MNTYPKYHPGMNRIRICRNMSGYSQKELAYLLGLSPASISKWEDGVRTVKVYHAIGLSVACNRLVDEIFSDYRHEWIETVNKRRRELLKDKPIKVGAPNANGER